MNDIPKDPSHTANEPIINSLHEYLNLILNLKGSFLSVYRGQPENKPLLPKIARSESDLDSLRKKERDLLHEFKVVMPVYNHPFCFGHGIDYEKDWLPLVLAQHHGLQTCLLDFTLNPLVALYFALEKQSENDSFVYYSHDAKENIVAFDNLIKSYPPQNISQPFLFFRPPFLDRRIQYQHSVFCLTKDPLKPLDQTITIMKLRIPIQSRSSILSQLDLMGVNRENLFPSLEGACKRINMLLDGYSTKNI